MTSDVPDPRTPAPLSVYLRENRLPAPAQPPAHRGRYYSALVIAWISFGSWAVSALSLVLGLLLGFPPLLAMIPLFYMYTFFVWSALGLVALLLTIRMPQCPEIRVMSFLGLILPLLSMLVVLQFM